MEFDQREADAAARLCAACEHEANEHGVCVFCGALKPDDPARAWEPPLRRPRMVGVAFTKRLPRKTLVRFEVKFRDDGDPNLYLKMAAAEEGCMLAFFVRPAITHYWVVERPEPPTDD